MTKDETLRLALEALEKLFGTPPTQWGGDVAVWRLGGSYRTQQAIHAIKEALAQPEPEPVEWAKFLHYPKCWDTAAYPTLHDAIHETLAWSDCSVCTSPKREWIGLTDEEIDKTYETQAWDARRSYARSIEAKLKEKNFG